MVHYLVRTTACRSLFVIAGGLDYGNGMCERECASQAAKIEARRGYSAVGVLPMLHQKYGHAKKREAQKETKRGHYMKEGV